MAVPTISWDETSPPGTQALSLVDDRIRELKTQLREVVGVDHVMSSSGNGDTWGYHNKVTLYNQGSNPTQVANAIILFAKDVSAKSRLHTIDEDGNVCQIEPPGIIAMWHGLLANIPAGWVLCDGNNSTPNLVAKFVRGVATAATNPGTTGGSDVITEAAMPTHTHSIGNEAAHTHATCNSANPFSCTLGLTGDLEIPTASPEFRTVHLNTLTTGAGSSHTHTLGNAGSGAALGNCPAFYEVAFIMKS